MTGRHGRLEPQQVGRRLFWLAERVDGAHTELYFVALPPRGIPMNFVEGSRGLPRPDQQYLLGHDEDEELRLRRQAAELHEDSARLFDRIGLGGGSRAIDLGCGPQGVLELLSERVGSTGHVIGIESNRKSVSLAKRFVADRALNNVTVVRRARPGWPEGVLT